jgi:hypothetical protein
MAASSTFKGCPPGKAEVGKPKIMVSGGSGVGKTWFSTSFQGVFFIDTEGGSDLPHYQKRLADSGGWYMGPEHGSLDFDSVIDTVKQLATTGHGWRTLVIDSFSKLYNTAAGIAEEKFGNDFGKDRKEANKPTRKLIRWLDRLDMSVVLVCHEKMKWADGELKGTTYDGWDKLEYELDLWLEAKKRGRERVGIIRKSRLTGFEQDTTVPLSYDDFAARYGKDIIEQDAHQIALATPAQVAELLGLLDAVRVPDETTAKWREKAGVDEWKDMTAEDIGKCIASLRAKLPKAAAAVA